VRRESLERITSDHLNVFISNDTGELSIIAESKLNPKNRAIHRHFFEKNQDGHFQKTKLQPSNIDQVFKNVKEFGISAGLYLNSAPKKQCPERSMITDDHHATVRHNKTQSETNFTSTGEKLHHHWPIFQKYRDTGFASIIRATMTLHQVCASKCSFCSTINRSRKDAISLSEAKRFVTDLYDHQASFNKKNFPSYNRLYSEVSGSDIRLKGLILSGGGQPNLWPHFSEFVEWLSQKDIELGLITNGFPKHVDERIYRHFKWIRLSITPEDASPFYPNQRFDLQRIPRSILSNEHQTFGLSYVYGPWTDDDIMMRLNIAASAWNASYVRVLTDCNLDRNAQIKAHQDLGERLFRLGFVDKRGNPLAKIFHQLKFHTNEREIGDVWADKICGLQLYNTFWDTTGHETNKKSFCFPCDSVTVLEEGVGGASAERRFNSDKWGTVDNTQVRQLYETRAKSFFDPNEHCKGCLFVKNNKIVKRLSKASDKDYERLNLHPSLDHVNFP
jgi:hypothetical protein